MQNRHETTFSIGDASRITGVSQRKLRSWEGKYVPKPERIVCGDRTYRRYTQTQINLIAQIKSASSKSIAKKQHVSSGSIG